MNKLIDKELGVIQTDMETASGDIIEHPWVGTVSTEEDIERDYEYQREQFYKLVDRGSVAIDGILELAKEGEHPRAYEVAGQLIKTQSEIAQNLLDLQDKLKKIKDVKELGPKNVTNALFVGSTTELQKMIKKNKDKK